MDMATGAEIWNITTDNSFCGSVAIGNGAVYLTEYNFDGDGALYALDASNGSVLWTLCAGRYNRQCYLEPAGAAD